MAECVPNIFITSASCENEVNNGKIRRRRNVDLEKSLFKNPHIRLTEWIGGVNYLLEEKL